jgi:hypothetical protein
VKRVRKTDGALLAGARGAERDQYFANGGDLAQWRGRSARFPLAPKVADKRAARGRTYREDY